MKVLISSGLTSNDVGGPAQYGPNISKGLSDLGHQVQLVTYGRVEKILPIGLRHLYFLIKILGKCLWADRILILDTYSVGISTVILSKLFSEKSIARVGGDFLWSAYVNRTGEKIPLPEFYENLPKLNSKEKIILYFTKFFIRRVDFLTFNTNWQREIWVKHYNIPEAKTGITRNFIPEKSGPIKNSEKIFFWSGRDIPEKNLDFAQDIFSKVSKKYSDVKFEIITNQPRQKVLDRAKSCYAVVTLALTDICPNSIIEGVSFNKPFIATSFTGINELYPDGGYFVDPRDKEGWVRAVENLLDDKIYSKFVDNLAKNNLTHSWEDIAEELIEIWDKI